MTAGLRKNCLFLVNDYVKAWFTAFLPTSAPNQVLVLLNDLMSPSRKVSAKIRLAALNKLGRHLWYLGERLVGLANFDIDVPPTVQRKIRWSKLWRSLQTTISI